MPKLRNIGPAVSLWQPEGGPDAFPVEAGQIIEVAGELVTKRADGDDRPLLDDAWHIANGDDERAWPKAQWDLVKGKTDSAAAAASTPEG